MIHQWPNEVAGADWRFPPSLRYGANKSVCVPNAATIWVKRVN
jgi:hypothetical protein